MKDDQACEVPFVEQLRSVPKDCKTVIAIQWSDDGTETGHRFIPVGFMMHRAADEIERLQAAQPEALKPDGPDGYAVVMDDKTSAPRGYWFTACYVRREPAEMVCKDTHSSRVVPIKFMNLGASSAALDGDKK